MNEKLRLAASLSTLGALLSGCSRPSPTTTTVTAPPPVVLPAVPAAAAATPANEGKLRFEKTRLDIGKVRAGETADLKFPFRNTHSQEIQIVAVDGDCGCVTPEFPRSVAAGGTGEIKARFEPQAYWDGKMEKSLTVRTTDPAQPETRLAIAVEVVPFVAIQPPSPIQVLYKHGETYQKEIRLTPREGSGIRITTALSDSPEVKATLEPSSSSEAKGAYLLKLAIGPHDKPGDFISTVRVQTSEARLPELRVVLAGLAQSGPVATPAEVNLPTVRDVTDGKELTRFQVFTRSGKLRVLSVDTGTPKLRAELSAPEGSVFTNVILRSAGAWTSGPMKATLTVRTDDPKFPEIKVPFQATVQ
jgi:hypothetical protein